LTLLGQQLQAIGNGNGSCFQESLPVQWSGLLVGEGGVECYHPFFL